MNHEARIHPALRLCFLVYTCLVGLTTAPPILAATIDVAPGAVGVAADGQCSLIEAIHNANSDSQADNGDCAAGAGADTIVLPPLAVFTLNNGNYANDTAEQVTGLPSITSDVTIDGNGATIERSSVAGTNPFRLFRVAASGRLVLDTLTLTRGTLTAGSGGAILNNGSLEVVASTLSGNTTFGSGGAIRNNTGATLVVRNSTLSGNVATARGSTGGGIGSDGTAEIYNATIAENGADNGAGLSNTGTMSLGNTIVASPNASAGDCSGTFVSLGHNIDTDGSCGLFQTSDLPSSNPELAVLSSNGGPTQTHPLFGDSIAVDAGGSDLCNLADPGGRDQRGYPRRVKTLGGVNSPAPGTCDIGAFEFGGSIIVVDESAPGVGEVGVTTNNFRCSLIEAIQNANNDAPTHADCAGGSGLGRDLIVLPENATFTLTNDNFANVPLPGGGVTGLPNITTGMYIDGNGSTIERSGAGGTVPFRLMEVSLGGALDITHVTLNGGFASDPLFVDSGGAIRALGTLFVEYSTIANNQAGQSGGGISCNFCTMWIYRNTFHGNTATLGGALSVEGGIALVAGNTFSGNAASAGGFGGAIYGGAGAGDMRLYNLTVTDNSAPEGGGIYFGGEKAEVVNVIVAGQGTGGNCAGTAMSSFGGNLSDDDSCIRFTAALDQTGPDVDADLGPLAPNGGPTLTHALGPNSDAIDRANGSSCNFLLVDGIDQRGWPRGIDYDGSPNNPSFGDCDSGAIEMRPPLIFLDSFE